MSVASIIANKAYGYEDAFGANDCASAEMRTAITEWFHLFYQTTLTKEEDPCQRIPYTIVNKLTKTMFGEYNVTGTGEFVTAVIKSLDHIRRRATYDALIGGIAYIKPFPLADRFVFSSVSRANMLIFGKDVEGNPTDVGTAEMTIAGNSYYTLLERRTVGSDGKLTIRNKLYRSEARGQIGRPVPLSSIPRYEALPDEYTYSEGVGLGMIPLCSPVPNCVDGSTDPVKDTAIGVSKSK